MIPNWIGINQKRVTEAFMADRMFKVGLQK